jgi:rubrerythrin
MAWEDGPQFDDVDDLTEEAQVEMFDEAMAREQRAEQRDGPAKETWVCPVCRISAVGAPTPTCPSCNRPMVPAKKA